MLAIPLLLFSADLRQWFAHAGSTVLSFGLCALAGTISALLLTFLCGSNIDEVSQVAGMLVGVYTGGTPNMQAIGFALGASEERFILLNAADLMWSGVYLIFLTTLAKKWLGMFLPKYQFQTANAEATIDKKNHNWRTVIQAILLGVLVVGLSLGATWLIFGNFKAVAFVILMLTSLSVLASFYSPIRELPGSFEAGEYLLLVFCVAIGMQSDFRELFSNGGFIVLFTGLVMIGSVLLHYLLSWLFGIDRDTTMITSTAAIFGPAFVGQIASVLSNREIIFAGVATGLVGYAFGNYLGLGVAYLVSLFAGL